MSSSIRRAFGIKETGEDKEPTPNRAPSISETKTCEVAQKTMQEMKEQLYADFPDENVRKIITILESDVLDTQKIAFFAACSLFFRLVVSEGMTEADYYRRSITKTLQRMAPDQRVRTLAHTASLLKDSTSYRDYEQLLDQVAQTAPDEREACVAIAIALFENKEFNKALRVTTLAAIASIPSDMRDDLIKDLVSFLSDCEVGPYDISDAIYAMKKIEPGVRSDAVKHTKLLFNLCENGPQRSFLLTAISTIAPEQRAEAIVDARSLFTFFKNGLGIASLLGAAAELPSGIRKEVLDDSKQLLAGLYGGSYVNKIFSAIAAIPKSERCALIEKALPLLQLTDVAFWRGDGLRAIYETAPERRDGLIKRALPLLQTDEWWNDSIATFLQVVATTDEEPLTLLLEQARNLIGTNSIGDKVAVLAALSELPSDMRQSLIEQIGPLLVGGIDLTDLAVILKTLAPMSVDERQSVLAPTTTLLNARDPFGRLALFQAVSAMPAEMRQELIGELADFLRNFKNSEIAQTITRILEHRVRTAQQRNWTLEDALTFWKNVANDAAYELPNIAIDQHLDRAVDFLSRLTNTAEYEYEQTRPLLAKRILDAFTCMAQDPEIKNRALDIIYHGVATCSDRIISALKEIELMIRLHKIEKSGLEEDELKKLAKQFLLLDMVNEKVEEHKKMSPAADEIELSLAFQIALADRFNLPISVRNMHYRATITLSDDEIAKIGDEIEQACSEEKVAFHLQTWGPWIQYQRRKAQIPQYDSLPATLRDISDIKCPLTQNTPEMPILYKDIVYDYSTFIRWYHENGKDPMGSNEQIDLTKIQRITQIQKNLL